MPRLAVAVRDRCRRARDAVRLYPHGKISAVVDPLGRQATFTYDNNNHLVTTVDMAGTRVEYTYDKASYMTAIATPGANGDAVRRHSALSGFPCRH